MNKTSVYLDDVQRAKLEQLSHITGQSQAALIRAGIDHVIEAHLPRQSSFLAHRLRLGANSQAAVDSAMEGFGQ